MISQEEYLEFKESSIEGRYIHLEMIEDLLVDFNTEIIGTSENNHSIYSIRIGNGNKKILVWSQMHGNESTGTKAMFDFLNLLNTKTQEAEEVLDNCTILFIPILNPDGALAYTRVNANDVDLNRDAVDLIAKESKVLRKQLDDFQPDFCFNLHDQRTIFGVEGTNYPAVLSFLAPSSEITRALTQSRTITMNVISAMNLKLQALIPNHIGRYTDEFYPTATGDNFQKLGFPTILIESGHYPNDYEREITRYYTFLSILFGIHHISKNNNFDDVGSYFSIPNNVKSFYDIVHIHPNGEKVAYQYEEKLKEGKLHFIPKKVDENDLNGQFGHKEIVFVD